jgi:hypothetical protein
MSSVVGRICNMEENHITLIITIIYLLLFRFKGYLNLDSALDLYCDLEQNLLILLWLFILTHKIITTYL